MVAFEGFLAQKMSNAISAAPVTRSHSCDIVNIAVKGPDEGEVPLPLEQVDAPFVLAVGDVQGEACFAFFIVEMEE